jgi:hypothetical protein
MDFSGILDAICAIVFMVVFRKSLFQTILILGQTPNEAPPQTDKIYLMSP